MTIELVENSNISRNNKMINGRINLTSKSYDLLRSFASLVDFEDTEFHEYRLNVSDIGIDYKRAQIYIDNIMGNPLKIKDDRKKKYQSFSWMSTMTYFDGYITAKLNPDMKNFMLQLKENGNYTKTFEKYIMPMDSIYAKRIYEMLKQNEDYGYRKFNLEELQEILNVPKSFMNYPNFKKFVLVIAIKEINKHTDIYINVDTGNLKDPSWIKLQCEKSRKITHLNFEFQMKNKKQTAPAVTAGEHNLAEPTKKAPTLVQNENDFSTLYDDLIDLNLHDEYDISVNNSPLIKLFYKYIKEQIAVFKQFCIDENKNYKNITTSFKRHIRGAFNNNLDFFASQEYLNRKEEEYRINEAKQDQQIEEFLSEYNGSKLCEMVLIDEIEEIYVLNSKLNVLDKDTKKFYEINSKELILKVVNKMIHDKKN